MPERRGLHKPEKKYYFNRKALVLHFFKTRDRPELDDAELLSLYKSGSNPDLLAILYSRYIDMLYAVALKYCDTREAAQDAVLQVFEDLPGKLKKHAPENFRGWIYIVVKNHCLMQLRRNGINKVIRMDDSFMQFVAEEHQDDIMEKEFQLTKMGECLESLSAEQKQSIELFYLQKRCYKEIVAITGLDFNKVRSLIQNGKRNLRICMDKKLAQ